MFWPRKSLTDSRMMEKSLTTKGRREWWTILSENLTKLAQHTELQLAVVLMLMLFCSLAVLDPWVGHTMDVLSPFAPVFCHFDWLFHGESCPRVDVVHPGRAWSSSPACTWHCSLHYLFLQATTLFPHGVTIQSCSMLASLLWRCLTVPSLLQLC